MTDLYAAGRQRLISWLNDLLGLKYSKVEQVATGAAFCQLFHILYPEHVPLGKVNFDAMFDYEYIHNWKIIQTLFKRIGLRKGLEVKKLIQAKYMDNLEILQWMYKYFNENYDGSDYDAVEQRNQALRANVTAFTRRRRASTLPSLNAGAGGEQLQQEEALPPPDTDEEIIPAQRRVSVALRTIKENNNKNAKIIARRNKRINAAIDKENQDINNNIKNDKKDQKKKNKGQFNDVMKKFKEMDFQDNISIPRKVSNDNASERVCDMIISLQEERDLYLLKLTKIEELCKKYQSPLPADTTSTTQEDVNKTEGGEEEHSRITEDLSDSTDSSSPQKLKQDHHQLQLEDVLHQIVDILHAPHF